MDKKKSVLILVADNYEDLEFWYPYYRLKEEKIEVKVAGLLPEHKSKHGYPVKPDGNIREFSPENFDAVIIPGGYAPDKMRRSKEMLDFVEKMNEKKKIVAAICHAGWVLISAGITKGRRMTCFFSIKDDLINSGAIYEDKDVVVDKNIVTSRNPEDLPAFCREIIKALK